MGGTCTEAFMSPSLIVEATGGLGAEMCLAMVEAGANIVFINLPGDPLQPASEESIQSVGCQCISFECECWQLYCTAGCLLTRMECWCCPKCFVNCAGDESRSRTRQE